MRSSEWLPASCLLLTPLRSVWAGVTPRAAIGDRGRSAKNNMDFDGAFFALKNTEPNMDRLAKWQNVLRKEKNEVWDILALEVASRFLRSEILFPEADHIANRLWHWMLALSSSESLLPDDAVEVYLAFDAGESATDETTDPVSSFTRAQLEAIISRRKHQK